MNAKLQQAIALHQQGKLAQAELLYREIVKQAPRHHVALHLMGVMAAQRKQNAEAVRLIDRALAIKPDYVEALNNRGVALMELKRHDEALASYDKALAITPDYADALNNRGAVLRDMRRFNEALESFDKLLTIKPDYAETWNSRGIVLKELRRLDEALASYDKALAIKLDHAEAWNNRGNVLHQLRRPDDALASYDRALAINADYVDALNNRANVLQQLKRLDEALASYDRALAIRSDYADALNNRSVVLEELQRPDEALASCDKALAIRPDYPEAWNNRGNALKALKRLDEALASYDEALAIHPGYGDAWYNRGAALQELERFDEALASYDKALALAPGHLDARYNRAIAFLLTGAFADGWRDYLARESMRRGLTGVLRAPLPADLRGRRVLVLADQGLGDELFFLRFAAGLKARGAAVLYRADPRIAAMIARAGAVDRVVPAGETPPDLSLTVSVGDLPYLLGMSSVADIPPPLALSSLPEAKQAMGARLAALGPVPYIGVTWRAGTRNRKELLFKEAPRAALAGVLADAPGTVVALQRQPLDGEIEAFAREVGRPVHDLTALNDSLEDMLAALALLDEYVCVSNTNVHLRAGTGRICRVLVPHPPEFRWMAAGNESPWFPGSRVYRQSPDGDWSAAFAALKDDLQ